MIPHYPGRCNAITTNGTPCHTKTREGGHCALHREHDRRAPHMHSTTPRCAGKADHGAPCFIRVHNVGDLCRHHRPPTSIEELQREANNLRQAIDRLDMRIAEFKRQESKK